MAITTKTSPIRLGISILNSNLVSLQVGEAIASPTFYILYTHLWIVCGQKQKKMQIFDRNTTILDIVLIAEIL